MKLAFIIFLKEVVDAVRDRRAWSVVLVTSLVSGPATLLMLSKFVSDLRARSEAKVVLVEGADEAPGLLDFLARQGRSVEPPAAQWRDDIAQGRFDDAVLQVPTGAQARIDRGESVELPILHDASRAQSSGAAAHLERLVAGWGRELALQRTLMRGVDLKLLRPVRPTLVASGPARGQAGRMLFLVPMVALISGVIGALSIAIDVTAGERERGSLEPLLLNPISPWQVVVGKWAAVSVASLLTLLGTVGSFAVAAQLIRDEGLAAAFQFGLNEAALTLGVLAPFCLLMSALLMLVSLFAKGHKEAQATTSYLLTSVSLAPSLALFLSLPDARWQLFVPALGQNMVLAKTFRGGGLGAEDLVIPALVALSLTVVTLLAQAWLLGREDILFARS